MTVQPDQPPSLEQRLRAAVAGLCAEIGISVDDLPEGPSPRELGHAQGWLPAELAVDWVCDRPGEI
jgi:hypothetical protein